MSSETSLAYNIGSFKYSTFIKCSKFHIYLSHALHAQEIYFTMESNRFQSGKYFWKLRHRENECLLDYKE